MPLRHIAVFLIIGGCASATELDVSYGPKPEQKLDICTPDQPGKPRPGVLLFHGGGWVKGSKLSMDRQCGAFVRHGFVAIPVDYRLAGSGPGTTWPAQIEDAQLALRWVRDNAARYGIDPGHICAEGESAGGQMALLLGMESRIARGDMASILPESSPQADCVVSFSGPTDLRALRQARPGLVQKLTGPVSSGVLAAELASGSPAVQADGKAAPVLLIQGENDPVVPYAQATEMRDTLSAAGVPVWLITHQGGHMLQGVPKPDVQAIWAAVFKFLAQKRLPGQPESINADDISVK